MSELGDEGLRDYGDWGELPFFQVAEPGGAHAVRSDEDRRVWKLGVELTDSVYRATHVFPDSERFGLTSQLRRAAVSVPSNVAEGWGRGSRADDRRFVRHARGSFCEIETQLHLARRFGYLTADESSTLRSHTQALARQLHSLVRALGSPQSP